MKTIRTKRASDGGAPQGDGEQGFMLLGLIVAIAIILIFLGAAATKVAFSLRREREVESARRADQYVRAIRRFYLKTQHYPGSLEQLENTNNVRYLRKRYVDPLTGKADYRLILVGQNKTTVKGFFGEPLAGIASTGLGAAAGLQASGVAGPTATPGGTAGAGGAANSGGDTSTGTTSSAAGTAGQPGSTTTTGAAGTLGSSIGSGLPGSVGPFMGVGSSATGSSILVVNEQSSYETWEFLYDPRLEKLRQAAALNAGAGSVGAGALGQTPGALGQPPGALGTGNGANSTNSTGSSGGNTPTGTTQPQP